MNKVGTSRNIVDCNVGFWVLFYVHVFMSFILEFSHGPCLCHASLALVYSCHHAIGSLVHCVMF